MPEFAVVNELDPKLLILSRGNPERRSRLMAVLVSMTLLCAPSARADAADTWIEVKAPHVTVLANGSTGEARALAWQVEQIRSVLVKIIPWARVDLDRPFLVLAVDNEQKMRALVPQYWEERGSVRPASVWQTGADRYYLAIRSDVQVEDRRNINPHVHAYFSYVSLVIQQSLDAPMPLWFTRGLSGILSNTIVRDSFVNVGAPIPWHLEYLRERARYRLPELIAVKPGARDLESGEGLRRFDAQAWAFVHFLLFADKGARAPMLSQFFKMVTAGTAPDVALAEAIGKVDQLEYDFVSYLKREVYGYIQLPLDGSVKREAFPERPLTAVEAASALALLHTAMRRPVEARAAIAEARKSGTPAPDSYLAEGLLLNREGKRDDARAALTRAVADGSTSGYAYYELARLQWTPTSDREPLAEREKLLARATELNPRHAWSFAMLADVRAQLGSPGALEAAAQAVRLDPSESDHRLTAARILWRAGQAADALKAVQVALVLASTDEAKRRAVELQQAIERGKP